MKTIIALVLAFSTHAAFAQTKAKRSSATVAPAAATTTTKASSVSSTDWTKNHLSVGLAIGTATAIDGSDFSFEGKKLSAVNISSSSPFGFAAQYESEINGWNNWKWTAGLTYFREITLDNAKARVNGQDIQGKMKSTFQPWIVSGGAQYAVNDYVYIPFGINRTLINTTSNGDMQSFSMEPQFGYQFGVGVRPNRNLVGELIHSRIAYAMDAKLKNEEGDTRVAKIHGDVRMEGFLLQGRYMF